MSLGGSSGRWREDSTPFLATLRGRRGREVARDHLEELVVCEAFHSRTDILDALAELDPRAKDGFALCGAAQYGEPTVISHLLSRGLQPTRAHRPTGESCNPLFELVQAATPSSLALRWDGGGGPIRGDADARELRAARHGRRASTRGRCLCRIGRPNIHEFHPTMPDAVPVLVRLLIAQRTVAQRAPVVRHWFDDAFQGIAS